MIMENVFKVQYISVELSQRQLRVISSTTHVVYHVTWSVLAIRIASSEESHFIEPPPNATALLRIAPRFLQTTPENQDHFRCAARSASSRSVNRSLSSQSVEIKKLGTNLVLCKKFAFCTSYVRFCGLLSRKHLILAPIWLLIEGFFLVISAAARWRYERDASGVEVHFLPCDASVRRGAF